MIRNLVAIGRSQRRRSAGGALAGFMAVVEHLQPRAVLVENVPDLPSWDDGAC